MYERVYVVVQSEKHEKTIMMPASAVNLSILKETCCSYVMICASMHHLLSPLGQTNLFYHKLRLKAIL